MNKENAKFIAVEIPKAMYESLEELAKPHYDGKAELLLLSIIRDYQSERWSKDYRKWRNLALEQFLIGLDMVAEKHKESIASVVFKAFNALIANEVCEKATV